MNASEDSLLPRAATLDTLRFPLWGSRLIEASAGTGKTYTIASLYVRLVLGHGNSPEQPPLTPPEILVVTFTRAATKELRDRIRHRLTEAAACFLQQAQGDDFLRSLLEDHDPERWPACARRLQIAAEWMDDAAVSTIDAWCYRMLREHAFDSGSLFEVELDADDAERVAEATRDYWRLFLAPLPPADLGRVLQLIAARMGRRQGAAADCDALAGIVARWLPHVEHYDDTAEPAVVLAGLRTRGAELKDQWRAWLPELRDLLQQAHADGAYDRSRLRINHWTGWLDKLDDWANDPESRAPFERKVVAWSRLTEAGLAEIWKKGEPPAHPALAAMAELPRQLDEQAAEILRVLPHAARWVAGRVADLRRQRATLSFNGLLEQLDAALHGPNGEKLARTLRAQFPAALIDEFQDTNPVQYRIFDRIYNVSSNNKASLLTLIGDPKQAIYGFRGADIHAYLGARRDCGARLYTLGSNYRSSPAMVAAVNHLFLKAERAEGPGAFLFRSMGADGAPQDPIPFLPVTAAADPGEWLIDGEPGTALTIWCDTEATTLETCAALVAESCASEILRLLQLGVDGRAGFRKAGEFRPLRSRDIAILVNNRNEAAGLRAALARRGVRSVYLSDDTSVYRSAAANDMLAWLRACAEPENGGHVRAALATAAIGLPWDSLDSFVRDEVLWEAMLERFAGYKEQWRRRGVLPMLRRFMHEFAIPARLFAVQGDDGLEGERHLTDLLHLAELLQAASVRLDGEHAVIRYLEEGMEWGGEVDADGDVSRMRLESDAGLVQIVTVHKSKGLEYGLVFYPHAYYGRMSREIELPAIYRDDSGKPKALLRPVDDPAELGNIRASLEQARMAEELRRLYVALTRARHATWIALAPVSSLPAAAISHLLGGAEACKPDALAAAVAELSAGCDDIAVAPYPSALEGRYQAMDDEVGPMVWRRMERRIEQRWGMSSYSSLARMALESAGRAGGLQGDLTFALPDEPRLDNFLEAAAAEMLASQVEGTAVLLEMTSGPVIDAGQSQEEAVAVLPAAGELPLPEVGIHAFPRGAAPGSFMHELLEWAFRQGLKRVLNEPDDLRRHIERRAASRGWDSHVEALTQWLIGFVSQAFRITLPAWGPQRSLVLADLNTVIPEMEFWVGVSDANLPRMDALIQQHFLAGQARASIPRGRLNGMLRGFIDLVFEHDGRYYVADYKSNWLGPADAAYDAGAIAQAILAQRYDLQSAIYLHALHRLLGARLGKHYDYETHVGGALIFFLRGHESAGQGLHIERPPLAVMESLDAMFEGMENGVDA